MTISSTSFVAIAKLVVLGAGLTAWITKVLTLPEAIGAVVFIGSSLSAAGFFAAKDAAAPDAQINVRQVGDEIRLEATTQDAQQKSGD